MVQFVTVTTSDFQFESETSTIFGTIRQHFSIIILMATLYSISFYTVTNNPRGFEIPALKTSFVLFAPSFVSLILISYIGVYLLYRYYFKPFSRNDQFYQLSWGLSFLVYGILFVGLSLQAFQVGFADMTNPKIFFFWRLPMIFWVSGMWIGTASLFTDNRKFIVTTGLSINLAGISWFVYGLLIIGNVEKTMYGFLFWLFIPMCVILAYVWWQYYRETKVTSARLISLGFSLMGLTYAAWAPWHFPDLLYMYFIFYQIFIVSLTFIFAGFFALPKELGSRVKD